MEFHRFDSRPAPARINRNVRILRILRTIKTNMPELGVQSPDSELKNKNLNRTQLRFDFCHPENHPDRRESLPSQEIYDNRRQYNQRGSNNSGDRVATGLSSERLSEVRAKMASGYYNSPEFMDKLADKLIDKLYLH